ncbi:hypothetical protein MBANPS3_009284 [Mucor bainieri]
MPIIEYFKEVGKTIFQSDQIFYRVDDFNHPGKTIDVPAAGVLASDPLLVELFNYKSSHMEASPRSVARVAPTCTQEQMIVDRLEVGQYAAALGLIKGMLTAGKKPPYSLWLALFNFIVTPVHSTTKEKHMNHWAVCQDAYEILLDVLKAQGAVSLAPIFNEFLNINLVPARQYRLLLDDRYEILDTKMLSKHSDFWEFANTVLSMKQHTLDTICHRWVLDVLVRIIQTDLLTRLGDEEDVKRSLLLGVSKKSRSTSSQRFDAYLRIILLNLADTHQDSLDFPRKLLNMFITIACFEEFFTMEHVVSHTTTFFEKMSASDGSRFLDIIEYPSFIILLDDKMFGKCDHSRVPEEFKNFRRTQHIPLDLHKLMFYVFSVLPLKPYTQDRILCHVQLVLKYCNSVFAASTIQHGDSSMGSSAFSAEALSELNEHKETVISKWVSGMETLVAACTDKNSALEEKIEICLRLTRVSLCTYNAWSLFHIHSDV